MIDISRMNGVSVDAERRRVTPSVQPGATLAGLDAATAPCGLALPVGTIGIAGADARWRFRDNFASAEVVTTSGGRLRAAADENADPLRDLRGGSNLGIVTRFEFQARPSGRTCSRA